MALPLAEPAGWQDLVLRRLAAGPASRAELRAAVTAPAPMAGRLDDLLTRLRDTGWLAVTALQEGRPQYTLEPVGRPTGPPPATGASPPGLSRFAIIRRDADGLLVESPLAWAVVRVHDPAVLTAIGALATVPGQSGPDGRPGPLPPVVAGRLWHDLIWAGLAAPAHPAAEEAGLRLRQWSPADLWFHRRSRAPVAVAGFGGTWWARGSFEPLPACRPPFAGPVVELPRPDLDRLRATDPPLTAVLEDRRSIRRHDDTAPVSVRQLGELLYRCARNRQLLSGEGVEYADRPYPSGGGSYELELYPVVRHAAGLAAGMYHYDPQQHRLERVCGPDPAVRRLLRTAAEAAQQSEPPQVLLVIAARFGRVMWKYEGLAYALILKHVGVLYQQICLVATAMGLAPCALGGGDPEAFVAATGLDPLVEGSVGELMLGSCPPASRSSGEPS